nr:MAG TPA: hypothetical protein [Caudoviricetes sp.]
MGRGIFITKKNKPPLLEVLSSCNECIFYFRDYSNNMVFKIPIRYYFTNCLFLLLRH